MGECRYGKEHSLIEILTFKNDFGVNTVRWCEVCGAVSVDKDCFDLSENFFNRVRFFILRGEVVKMKIPQIAKEVLRIKNDSFVQEREKIKELKRRLGCKRKYSLQKKNQKEKWEWN